MKPKPVPTFGTAGNYMQLLWRMDAMYSGQRVKPLPSRRNDSTLRKLIKQHCADVRAPEDSPAVD